MLNEIITNPAFWFWTLVIVQSALVIWFVEMGQVLGASFSVLALLVGVAFFPGQWELIGLGGLNESSVWDRFSSRFGMILAGLGIYLMIGLAWGTLRWWMHVRDLRDEYDLQRSDWLAPISLYKISEALRAKADYCRDSTQQSIYVQWAEASRRAADAGGNLLTSELRPIWKEYVKNGYRN